MLLCVKRGGGRASLPTPTKAPDRASERSRGNTVPWELDESGSPGPLEFPIS